MTAHRLAEIRPVLELAPPPLRVPVGAALLELEQLHAVEPVLDVRAAREDTRLVPLANWLLVSGRRRIERVGGARAGQPCLVAGALLIVEQLILRRGPVDPVVLLGAAIEDAAV